MLTWLDRGLDAVAVVYALLLFPGPFFWLIIHPGIGFWRKLGKRSFWVALPLWLAFGFALWEWRHGLLVALLHRTVWTWLAGACLAALGFWIDHQVSRIFSLRRLVGLPEIDPASSARKIVRSGIYARLRHPRYAACMLTFAGLALLTAARGIFLLAILTVVMYVILAPVEERELRKQFGREYESYARAVPRFIPRLRRTAGTPTDG